MEREARVVIKADGDEEVVRAANRIDSAWKSAGSGISGSFKGAAGAVTDAAASMLSDLGHVATAAGAISFAGSVQSVHALEEGVTRMGVAAGRDIRSVQDGINTLSGEINSMPSATAAWVQSVGELTYSYEGAAQAAKGMAGYAALTGQTQQQVQGLAVALAQVGGVAGDTSKAIGIMAAQAKALGTIGGVKALGDEFQHLASQISNLSGPAEKTTALLAGFGGKAGTPMQRERALGSIMSRIESDPRGVEMFLRSEGMLKTGERITDKFGHVTDMTGILEKIQHVQGKGGMMATRLESTLGREAMGLLGETSFADVRKGEGLDPSRAASSALDAARGSEAGQLRADAIKKDIAMQQTVGSDSFFGGIYKAVSHLAGDHPIATAVGLNMLPKLAGAGLKALRGGQAVAAAAGEAGAGGAGLLGGLSAAGLAAASAAAIANLAPLIQLGEGSAVQQGFANKSLSKASTPAEIEALSGRAASANAAAGGAMSPGMQAALVREQDAKHMRDTVAELTKAGASLQLAQETARQIIASGQRPITITVINGTGGDVDAQLRGDQ